MGDGSVRDDIAAARAWIEALRKDDGKISNSEATLVRAIETCPEIGSAIAFDTRRGRRIAQRSGPWGDAGPWTDAMTARLVIYFQQLGIPARPERLETALIAVADENHVDPLGDWLSSLRWDGTPRLEKWLVTYAGAKDTPAVRLIGKKFLVGMMARATKPGCQMDYALAEEGEQAKGKSTLARILGGEYFAGDLPDFHSRDAQQIVTSSLVIEIADLAALGRSSLEKFKAFMTQTHDTFIPKWGRHPVKRPRWGVFILSVNPTGAGYLADSTGNRRAWPVEIGTVKAAELARDRDQLFAEALDRLANGAKWWPEGEAEWALLKGEQEAREVEDAWTPIIAEWLENDKTGWPTLVAQAKELNKARKAVGEDEKPLWLTTAVIAHCALHVPLGQIERGTTMRIGTIMKKLDYPRRQQRVGKRRIWIYENGGGDGSDSGVSTAVTA
jgi:predicted P-loop ATPase